MKRYAVFGPGMVNGEIYANRGNVYKHLASLTDVGELLIGGGKGVDVIAKAWAEERGIPVTVHRPDFRQRDNIGEAQVFTARDMLMLQSCDAVALFSNAGLHGQVTILCGAIALKKTAVVFHV